MTRNGTHRSSGSRPSLIQLLASGDEDAIAGFRDAHTDQVRRYCMIACGPELADDALEAAFVDFLGRVLGTDDEETGLETLLLKATRSAAAARFAVPEAPPSARPELCAAVPELLAARANGELSATDHLLSSHVRHCERCQATAAQTSRAEEAFQAVSMWAEQSADTGEPGAPVESPAPALQSSTTVRRRTGGLVGKLTRGRRSGPQPPGGPSAGPS